MGIESSSNPEVMQTAMLFAFENLEKKHGKDQIKNLIQFRSAGNFGMIEPKDNLPDDQKELAKQIVDDAQRIASQFDFETTKDFFGSRYQHP